jgi:hypothetical protein
MTSVPATRVRGETPQRRAVGDDAEWSGPTRSYDLVKEFVVAVVVVALLTVGLALLFGSPDERAVPLQQWARAAPNDFVATAVSELNGTSGTATYGPPYNHNSEGQKLGPLPLARWGGVRLPVDAAHDFVLAPLSTVAGDAQLSAALNQYTSAADAQQNKWATAYGDALAKAPEGDPGKVPHGDYGPVPLLVGKELRLAQSGGLDGVLTGASRFYTSDYTKPLLFLADGNYLAVLAQGQHLSGDQWGMMNETGGYPGQAWLWLYTFWYQVKPFSTGDNADALVWGLMAVLTLGLILLPLIPGLRSLPRHLRVYRLIWREHYRSQR